MPQILKAQKQDDGDREGKRIASEAGRRYIMTPAGTSSGTGGGGRGGSGAASSGAAGPSGPGLVFPWYRGLVTSMFRGCDGGLRNRT